MSSKELLELLTERGFVVKTASSTVDNISAESLVEEFGKKASEPEIASPEQVAAKTVEPPPAPSFPKPALPPGIFVKSRADVERERKEKLEEEGRLRKPIQPMQPKVMPPSPKAAPPSHSRRPQPTTYIRKPFDAPTPQQPAVPVPAPVEESGGPQSPEIPPSPVNVAPTGVTNPQPASPPKPPSPAPEAPPTDSEGVGEVAPAEPVKLITLQVKPPIVVRDFAEMIQLKPFRLISELMEKGIFASMNQVIEEDVAQLVAGKHGFHLDVRHRGEGQPEVKPKKVEKPVVDESKLMEPRPPVVCILGHVDHGKTTLLDTIRNANVVAGEAGGITQHIGAYQIEHGEQKITFIDTPGHAAFSKMRARGAGTTDIAILVVAADDGFMPQTDEALGHAQVAGVPLIVAINKTDTKGADIDRVKTQMQERNIASEDWGGETLCVSVSALKGEGIDVLLDSILLQAEIMDTLKANPQCRAEGVVLETQKEMGRGATASVIIQKGTLKQGDALLCGSCYCRVRAIMDDKGNTLKKATPAMPVKVIGWTGTPDSGNLFTSVKNEKEAKRLAEENAHQSKVDGQAAPTDEQPATLENLFAAIAETKKKIFRVVVKSDVFGTAEALAESLLGIKSDKVDLEVVQTAVGPISKNDVLMASASEAAIVGFNINMESGVSREAKHRGITIYLHNVIYELIDLVKEAMAETLDAELRENKIGVAQVRQIFPVAKGGQVAGCLVTEGRMVREGHARILRAGEMLFEGKISALKRFKDDATEVRAGYECGVRLGDFGSFKEGDQIECYEILKIRPTL